MRNNGVSCRKSSYIGRRPSAKIIFTAFIFVIITLCVCMTSLLTSCDSDGDESNYIISHIDGAIIDGDIIFLEYEYNIRDVDFLGIKVALGARFEIYRDIECTDILDGYLAPLQVGENRYYLKVYSEKGKTKVYEYIILRSISSNTDIINIPNGMTIENNKLTLTLSHDQNSFDISQIIPSEGSSMTCYMDIELTMELDSVLDIDFGNNTFYILITAPSGDEQEYELYITRNKSSEKNIIVTYEGATIEGNIHTINSALHIEYIDLSKIVVSDNAVLVLYRDSDYSDEITNHANIELIDCDNLIFARVVAQDDSYKNYLFHIICVKPICTNCDGDQPDNDPSNVKLIQTLLEENIDIYNLDSIASATKYDLRCYYDIDMLHPISGKLIGIDYGKNIFYAVYECILCGNEYDAQLEIYRKVSITIGISDELHNSIDITILLSSLTDQWRINIDGIDENLMKIIIDILQFELVSDCYISNSATADIYVSPYEYISLDFLKKYCKPIASGNVDIIGSMPQTALALVGDSIDYALPYSMAINCLAYNSSILNNVKSISTLQDLMNINNLDNRISILGNAPSTWDFLTYNAWLNVYGREDIIAYNRISTYNRYANTNKLSSSAPIYGLFQSTASAPIIKYDDCIPLLMTGKCAISPILLDSIDRQLLDSGVRLQGLTVDNTTSLSTLFHISTMITANLQSALSNGIISDIISQLYSDAAKSYLLNIDKSRILATKYTTDNMNNNNYSDMYIKLLINAEPLVVRNNDYLMIDPYPLYALSVREELQDYIDISTDVGKFIIAIMLEMNIDYFYEFTPATYQVFQFKLADKLSEPQYIYNQISA